MTLRKKIVLSNVFMIIFPIVLMLAFWTGYVHHDNGTNLKPINRASEGGKAALI